MVSIADRPQNGGALAEDNAGGYTQYCSEGNFFRKIDSEMMTRGPSHRLFDKRLRHVFTYDARETAILPARLIQL
jgi:hypothetical protein